MRRFRDVEWEAVAGVVAAVVALVLHPFDVPRYVFHVQGHSELIGRLSDLERDFATGSRGA